MEEKKIVAVIGAIDVVLLLVCVVLYLGKDRKGPEIIFDEEKQIVYSEEMDVELLLEGVTAVDEKDGDVSESLLVEKVAGTNGREVIVTYVARDGANNVGKASRAFAVADNYSGGNIRSAEEETFGKEKTSETETVSETGTGGKEDSSSSLEDEGQEENQEEEKGPNPVLVLNADVIETEKGTAPNWNEVIETMSDDKDDYNTLYNNLKLEGQVKLNEAGEYPVTLYTVDADGNRSEVSSLVVKVN